MDALFGAEPALSHQLVARDEAARYDERVGGQHADAGRCALAIAVARPDADESALFRIVFDARHHGGQAERRAERLRELDRGTVGIAAGVQHEVDRDARLPEIHRGAIAFVAGGRDERAGARRDGVPAQQRAGALRQHDARPVVVGENQRALPETGRDHYGVRRD